MLKKIILSSLALLTFNAFADAPDYYSGFQLGYSNTEKSSANTTVNNQAISLTPDKHAGPAVRLFVGYAVTPFYAMEIGLEKYNTATWHTVVGNQSTTDTQVTLYGADMVMRFNWIRKSTFTFYNNLGLTGILAQYGSYNGGFQLNKSHYFLRPKIGVGANYAITDNTQVNLSYTHIFGRGHLVNAVAGQNSKDYLPTIGILGLGLIYNF